MPVTAADLKLFAAATQTDAADGGGPRGSAVLQNGSTEVFPAVSNANRTTGNMRLRKVYPSLTNADSAALLGASVAINEVPADTAVSVAMFAAGDATTRRAAAEAAFLAWHKRPNLRTFAAAAYTGPDTFGFFDLLNATDTNFPAVGEVVGLAIYVSAAPPLPTAMLRARVVEVGPFQNGAGGGFYGRVIRIDRPHGYVSGDVVVGLRNLLTDTEVRLYGACAVPGSLSSGATAITVSSTSTQVVPYTGSGTYPAANLGIDPAPLAYANGRVQVVKDGDVATLWHEDATTPSTYSNGNTVNVGRTSLDQMALVDATGVEVQRWLDGVPTPAGAFATVNLSTGVLTFSNVTGLAQPCFVRHRIAHRSLVSSVSGTTVNMATALTRSFAAGAVISTHLPLGDVQARALTPYGQQAWTNVWSDALIGSPASLQYTGAITVTNAGAENDRYAIVFTAANAFKCYSERLGLLASGTTTATFAPLNAATGAALFSLASSGWASEILVGGVLRFNTAGACPPVWALQCIKPSSPSGTTRTAIRTHGSVA